MKGMLFVGLAIATTVVCWGLYGPVLNWAQEAMNQSRFRPLIVIGSTYFLITALGSAFYLWTNGDQGNWTAIGISWSIVGGAVAATGAMSTIAAFNLGGRPVYVMPVVFGGAPIVTALITITWYRQWKEINPLFYTGLIMVCLGAAMVLFFAPAKPTKSDKKATDKQASKKESTLDGDAAKEATAGEAY